MFTQQQLELAKVLTSIFLSKNQNIKPIEHTPLAGLVKCVDTTVSPPMNEKETADFINNIINGTKSLKAIDDVDCSYDLHMNILADKISEKLKEHLNFIRTIVTPSIQEFDSEIRNEIDNMSASEILNKSIIIKELPEILTRGFRKLIDQYRDDYVSPKPLCENIIFSQLDGETILSLVKLGIDEFDKELFSFLELNKPEAVYELVKIYNYIFRHIEVINGIEKSVYATSKDIFSNKNDENLKWALIAFLIGLNLIKSTPLDGVVSSKSNYLLNLTNVVGQAGWYLNEIIERYLKHMASNKLVLSVNNDQTVVNGPVYRKWIIEGGDTDVILGNSLLDKPYQYPNELTENKDDLLNGWRNYAKVTQNKESIVVYNFLKSKILENLKNRLNIKATTNEISGDEAITRYNQAIREFDFITSNDLINNLSDTLIKLMCRIIYPNTDAEFTLSNIQLIASEQANTDSSSDIKECMDIREAALLAIMDYVIQWVGKQMTTSYV